MSLMILRVTWLSTVHLHVRSASVLLCTEVCNPSQRGSYKTTHSSFSSHLLTSWFTGSFNLSNHLTLVLEKVVVIVRYQVFFISCFLCIDTIIHFFLIKLFNVKCFILIFFYLLKPTAIWGEIRMIRCLIDGDKN